MLLGDLFAGAAARRARGRGGDAAALFQSRRLQLAVEALEPAGSALRLLRRRRPLHRDVRGAAQHGRPADAEPDAACLGGGVVGRGSCRNEPCCISRKIRRLRPSLGRRYGYRRPAGGFFLWLDVSKFGGSAQASVTLWQRAGVKVLPGAFLAQAGRDGTNPGRTICAWHWSAMQQPSARHSND